MRKKGQLQVLGIMLFFMVFITMVVMINPMKVFITDARSSTNLDCANNSIPDQDEMTCIVVGSSFPLYIGVTLAVALGLLGLREIRFRQGGLGE